MNWKFWKKTKQKSAAREWIDALLFAIIAATIIRAFLIEAFTIPTPSMENSLMVGDFLFVSKVSYGPRAPMTPLAFPLVHQTLPIIGTKSYSDLIKWKYKRFSGFGNVERYDAVVFNYPMEDDRPIDKKTHYIKRCIGLPGDSLKIVNRQVYINDSALVNPIGLLMKYTIQTDGTPINPRTLEKMGIVEGGPVYGGQYSYLCTAEQAEIIKQFTNVTNVFPSVDGGRTLTLPYTAELPWSKDEFGSLYIPKQGSTIPLNSITTSIYGRAITTYEGNTLTVKDSIYLVNGQAATSYTFKMNYYFMMGDNRDNSSDSRFWGFVPENHVVGKAVFIWLSLDYNASFFKKIRWSRLFSRVRPV